MTRAAESYRRFLLKKQSYGRATILEDMHMVALSVERVRERPPYQLIPSRPRRPYLPESINHAPVNKEARPGAWPFSPRYRCPVCRHLLSVSIASRTTSSRRRFFS
jgi:hypothetical protein